MGGAAATLALENTTFNGALPTRTSGTGTTESAAPADGAAPAEGGADGVGGSSFDVNSFSVLGLGLGLELELELELDPTTEAVGPLSAVTLTDGRSLSRADAGAHVAVLDSSYATSASLVTGGTAELSGGQQQRVAIARAGSRSRPCCSPMSPPETSTRKPGTRSWTCSRASGVTAA